MYIHIIIIIIIRLHVASVAMLGSEARPATPVRCHRTGNCNCHAKGWTYNMSCRMADAWSSLVPILKLPSRGLSLLRFCRNNGHPTSCLRS